MPDMRTMVSSRERASRAELAWTVEREPSWPVFMAWSMSSTSAPRTSPTTMFGSHAEGVAQEVPLRHGALSLDVGGARLEAYHMVLLQLQLRRVLDRHDAL